MEMRKTFLGVGLAIALALVAVTVFMTDHLTTTSASDGGPEMSLTVSAGGDCVADKCTVAEGGAFTLSVGIDTAPADGYTGAQIWVNFGTDLVYKPTETAADEVVWPDCESAAAVHAQLDAENLNIGCLSGLISFVTSTYAGNAFDLSFNCSSAASSTLVELLPLGDDVASTSGSGFRSVEGGQITAKVNNVTINCGAGNGGPTEEPTTGPTEGPTVEPTTGPTDVPTDMPTATPSDQPCGDIDGDGNVQSTDALWILWFTAELVDELAKDGDMNGDGTVDSRDAALVLQIVAGLYSC